ncbi:MAG: nitroreductase family protein [Saprospiraceae bacterium]|nr:nitroreductase family protein [Saprospiraceae bacterium]
MKESGSDAPPFIRYYRPELDDDQLLARSKKFREELSERRSVRHFSPRPVAKEVIEHVILTAASAPSGAHKQPWTFCAISDPLIKSEIRQAAELEEKQNYGGRMSAAWLDDLEPFATNWQKPMLETAPWLIVVFRQMYTLSDHEEKVKNYYVSESVGIATGILLAAIHQVGLVALTHTPSPMNFLERILNRPSNERAFLLIPVGHPDPEALVPNLNRKKVGEVLHWHI